MIEKFRRKQERLNELLEWLDGERLKHISTFGQEPETLFGKELSKYTIDELIEKYRKDKRKPNGGGSNNGKRKSIRSAISRRFI